MSRGSSSGTTLEAEPESGFHETRWDSDPLSTQKRVLQGLAVPPGAEKGPLETADLPPMRRGWRFRTDPYALATQLAAFPVPFDAHASSRGSR